MAADAQAVQIPILQLAFKLVVRRIAVVLVLPRERNFQILEGVFVADAIRQIGEYLPITPRLVTADGAADRIALNQAQRFQELVLGQYIQMVATFEELHDKDGRSINMMPDFRERPAALAGHVTADAEGSIV